MLCTGREHSLHFSNNVLPGEGFPHPSQNNNGEHMTTMISSMSEETEGSDENEDLSRLITLLHAEPSSVRARCVTVQIGAYYFEAVKT